MGLQQIRNRGAATAAILGLGALLVGCSREVAGTPFASNTAGAPVAVSCEPNQRAVVRQVAVNGAMQSQVQCESVVPSAFAPAGMSGSYGATVPAGYAAPAPAVMPVGYTTGYVPAPGAYDNAQIVRTAYPRQVVTRQAAPQRVVYQRAPERIVRQGRSVKKSAVIIGSSAGIGAGIGAAVGGKKGAGIGALIGGGSAALWDQMTRRK